MNKNLQKKFFLLIFLLLSMIFIPLLSVCGKKETLNLKNNINNFKSSEKIKNLENNFFQVLDNSNGKIIKIPDKEFLCGVVTSEMPAMFEKEALKAQAVASYTYFCKERLKSRKTIFIQRSLNIISN